MDFRVLGPLEVVAQEGNVRLGGLKPRAVLAHLLIRANHVVPAEVLIDELWGEELPEDARNAVQTHVSRLRSVLGDGRIERRDPGYVLRVESDELDAARFESMAADARADLAENPASAARQLAEALALWRGPAYSDLAGEPSLAGEIARLEELRLTALEDRISAELALGHHARLVGELEALAREHPLRERVWGDLMLALYRSGRQADALDAYGRARGILSDQLGIDPSHRLQRLHERILAQDSALSVASRPMPIARLDVRPGELAPDTRIAGYRIEDLLGRGGMSTVYLAEDVRLTRRIALKILSPELAQQPGFRERFVRESQIAAGMEHPGIVPIYEAGETEGLLYIAMRYVRGTDLGRLLADAGPLEPERAVRIVSQVAEALDAAHAEGLVHRDVKPGNILIVEGAGSRGRDLVYLSDFGLTKRLEGDSGALTKTGQFVGTVDYVAPEQIEGGRIDARTDVYSLGCVLFECLTGKPPHARETEVATLYAHLSDDLPRVRDARPDLPVGLGTAVDRALARDPSARYATCGELASDASEAFAPAAPAPAVQSKRRLVPAAGATALAIAVIALVALSLGRSGDPSSPSGGTGAASPAASPTAAPHFTAIDRPPTAEEQRLVALIPPNIAGSCVPAEPRAPSLPPDDALGAVACSDGTTQALYELFGSRDRLNVAFGNRANRAGTFGGDCATDHEAQNPYTVSGEGRGRVMCHRTDGKSMIAWTDENLLVLGQAIRDDLGDLSLYEWWITAGPIDADTAPEKDGGSAAVAFPQTTVVTEVTDEDDLREMGITGGGSATQAIMLSDGTYRFTGEGAAYFVEPGTYVLSKGQSVAFTADDSTSFCPGGTTTYEWEEARGGGIRWTFVEHDGCPTGPFPTTDEPWLPGPEGEIVFGQYGNILIEDVGQLTATPLIGPGSLVDNAQPAWSPDGGRIAFSSNRPDPASTFDLYVMNPDGSDVTQLTSDGGNEWDPAWAPDGASIAFASEVAASSEGGLRSALKVIPFPANGTAATTIAEVADEEIGHPSWSPDGSRIAFAMGSAIYVVDADGSNLTTVVPDQEVLLTAPVWHPDGDRIVFWGDDPQGGGTLLTVRPDGTGLRRFPLDVPDSAVLVPAWSPDGQWLTLGGLFTLAGPSTSPLYVVNLDGGPFYTYGLNVATPNWRPKP
jgi:serine/threonine-protein kinase